MVEHSASSLAGDSEIKISFAGRSGDQPAHQEIEGSAFPPFGGGGYILGVDNLRGFVDNGPGHRLISPLRHIKPYVVGKSFREHRDLREGMDRVDPVAFPEIPGEKTPEGSEIGGPLHSYPAPDGSPHAALPDPAQCPV